MKKILLVLFLILIIGSTVNAVTLHETITSNQIATGTTLKKYVRFTDKGWLNINVLEVDLTDRYTDITLLTPSTGVGKTQNLKAMATNITDNCVAAINGDFFAASSGKGHSMGIAINNNEIISSSYSGNLESDSFATFMLDEDYSPLYEFVSNKITLTSKKTRESIEISEINKYPDYYNIPAVYTSAWGTYSIGSTDDLPMTEIVVKNNKVSEIRINEPAVEIPNNGYVISATGDGAEFLKNNFKKGTKVELDIETSIDIDDIEFAISGGAQLINDGKIPDKFSSNISGTHPRTAIGTSKDGETLYLVTVDGRQQSSVGMTQQELAEFLLDIEVYNAINLDGGGSTTMLARKLGDTTLSTINTPSGGALRAIINGIGIVTTSPSSKKVSNIVIEISDTNIFKGKEREIIVKAYNKYYEPIEINQEDVEWSYDGVPVTVKDGILIGDTVGMTMLQAEYKKQKTEIEINILSNPHELAITPKKSTISSGKNVSFKIEAKNKNGYYSTLNNDEITWKIESYFDSDGIENKIPKDASLKENIFTATTAGDYIISVSDNDIKTYALITVSGKIKTIINDFENINYKFDPYPDEVTGNAEKSNEESHNGNYSCKLSYDFNQDIQIRAAYIEFNDGGIDIPETTTEIGFWVYNASPKDDQIKLKIKDINNTTHLLVVQKGITHEGWQEFKYSLKDISLPAKLTDIYVAQDKIDIKSSGYIYIDDLTFYGETTAVSTNTNLPKDIKGIDESQKYVELKDNESFRIALFDEIKSPNLMIENLRNKKIINAINKNSEIAIFTSQKDNSMLTNIETTKLIYSNYSTTDYKNSKFITINCLKNGIRNTDSTQWTNLQKDIKNTKQENIFVIMNDTLDNFNDESEKRLFIDVLCELKRETGKNIWVLHKGNYTDYSMKRGIKYLGINNNTSSPDEILENTNFFLITVNGKELSYEIKNVFEK